MTYTRKRTAMMRKRVTVRGRRRDRNVVVPPTLRYRSTSMSNSRSRKRACSRLRMRPWLEGLLDREECSILKWEDKERKKFSIAWRHASSHGFDQSQHGDLFYMWAQHTGKLKKNNRGDHSNNKSTFRCALHSLKDCIELTQKGDKKGEGAKRTYQFIEPGHSLYDRKRKRTSRRNKVEPKEEVNNCSFEMRDNSTDTLDHIEADVSDERCSNIGYMGGEVEPKEEVDNSGFEFQETSTSTFDYLEGEEYSAVTNVTLQSHAESEVILRSPDSVPSSLNNDIKGPVTLSTSPLTTTTFPVLSNPFTTDGFGVGQSVPNFLIETQSDGVISLTLPPLSQHQESINGAFGNDEPVTSQNQLPNFSALSLPETYVDLNSICNPDLSCGGSVKVHKNKQETLSQPEFHIDYSLISPLLQQQQQISLEQQQQISLEQQQQISLEQQQQISLEQQQQISLEQQQPVVMPSDSVYDYTVEVTTVDVADENVVELIAVDEPNEEENLFPQYQTLDQYQRVLAELQPVITDASLSAVAVEDEIIFDEFTNFLIPDIFSVGAC